MKLKKWVQIIGIGLGVIALAACHSQKKQNQWSMNDNSQQGVDGAQSSGLGDEDRLSDGSDDSHAKHLVSKNTYYFDYDSDTIHSDDRQSIDTHAKKLASNTTAKVMLEGHTDPRGSREYNIGLGERRAKAVAEAMASKGVKSTQLRLVSYGAEKLAAPGTTESDYQKDRRVVLVNTQNQG
jgi:peptidoglycan-associated lipoprotein